MAFYCVALRLLEQKIDHEQVGDTYTDTPPQQTLYRDSHRAWNSVTHLAWNSVTHLAWNSVTHLA
jgi:hypothetical protein